MILPDTSVWVDHIREAHPVLNRLLADRTILIHPDVIGEIACGNLARRGATLAALRSPPWATVASNDDVLTLLEQQRLWGRGLGWIDVHLLASAILSGSRLWTRDARLAAAATELGANFLP